MACAHAKMVQILTQRRNIIVSLLNLEFNEK